MQPTHTPDQSACSKFTSFNVNLTPSHSPGWPMNVTITHGKHTEAWKVSHSYIHRRPYLNAYMHMEKNQNFFFQRTRKLWGWKNKKWRTCIGGFLTLIVMIFLPNPSTHSPMKPTQPQKALCVSCQNCLLWQIASLSSIHICRTSGARRVARDSGAAAAVNDGSIRLPTARYF